jgi:hypothetical protein
MTPFRNVALMCPATTKADVDTHTSVFGAAADGLIGWRVNTPFWAGVTSGAR